MLKFVNWFAVAVVLTFLIWQSAAIEPMWPRVIICILLLIAGLVVGIHIGTTSTAAYVRDLQRLNKVLADQNRDLQDVNAMLLREVESQSATPPKSTCA